MSPIVISILILGDKVFQCTWSPLIQLDKLSGTPQESFCLCLPSVGDISMCLCGYAFFLTLGRVRHGSSNSCDKPFSD